MEFHPGVMPYSTPWEKQLFGRPFSRFTSDLHAGNLRTKSPGVPIQRMERAEIIPVEPDPDHAGAREVETLSSAPKIRGAFL